MTHTHGGNHTHISAALKEALGEDEVEGLMNDLHEKCKECTKKAIQETQDSLAVNLQVLHARRAQEAAEQMHNEAQRVLADVTRIISQLSSGSGDTATVQQELAQISASIHTLQ